MAVHRNDLSDFQMSVKTALLLPCWAGFNLINVFQCGEIFAAQTCHGVVVMAAEHNGLQKLIGSKYKTGYSYTVMVTS